MYSLIITTNGNGFDRLIKGLYLSNKKYLPNNIIISPYGSEINSSFKVTNPFKVLNKSESQSNAFENGLNYLNETSHEKFAIVIDSSVSVSVNSPDGTPIGGKHFIYYGVVNGKKKELVYQVELHTDTLSVLYYKIVNGDGFACSCYTIHSQYSTVTDGERNIDYRGIPYCKDRGRFYNQLWFNACYSDERGIANQVWKRVHSFGRNIIALNLDIIRKERLDIRHNLRDLFLDDYLTRIRKRNLGYHCYLSLDTVVYSDGIITYDDGRSDELFNSWRMDEAWSRPLYKTSTVQEIASPP